jgi:hypothetical protein
MAKRVYNVTGKLITTETVLKGTTNHQINVPSLPKGAYIIQVLSENTILFNQKLIKQ